MMSEILVFDPALCCSTGVCGPEVDDTLVRFAADLEWLKGQGVVVRRFNLAQEGAAFARNTLVRTTLQREGTDCLPLVLCGEEILSRGRYPSRDELVTWSGMAASIPSVFTDPVAELVAIGAAVAANSEASFDLHFQRARELGVSPEDVRKAVSAALTVKGAAARHVRERADQALASPVAAVSAQAPAREESSSCCGPQVVALGGLGSARGSSSGCC